MIKQAPVDWENIADFISSVGKDNIISILPIKYEYSEEGLITHRGQQTENVGSAIISKYLIVYNY